MMDNPFLLLHSVGRGTRGDICTCTQCTPKVFPPSFKASPAPLGRMFFVSALLLRDVLLGKTMPPSCLSEDVNLPKQMSGRGTPDNSVLILCNLYNALPAMPPR